MRDYEGLEGNILRKLSEEGLVIDEMELTACRKSTGMKRLKTERIEYEPS